MPRALRRMEGGRASDAVSLLANCAERAEYGCVITMDGVWECQVLCVNGGSSNLAPDRRRRSRSGSALPASP